MKPSKPTYEELLIEFEEFINLVVWPNNQIMAPLTHEDWKKLRDGIGKARAIISRAKEWQSQALHEAITEEAMAHGVIPGPEPTAEHLGLISPIRGDWRDNSECGVRDGIGHYCTLVKDHAGVHMALIQSWA